MFNVLDLVILAVLLLSGLIAAWRGFTREVLSIGAWIGAAVVMFVFGPQVEPFAAHYVEKEIIAKIAAYAAVFVVALLPLSYVSYRISEGVRDSAIGAVDRLFGFAFGIARGLVIVGVGFLVFTSLVGESRQPDWFREAKLRPLMEGTGKVIASLLPSHDSSASKGDGKPAEEPVIGGKKKPEGAAAAPKEEEPAETAGTEPPAPPAPAPKPKPPKPATEDGAAAPGDSASAQPQGYGERERDALDQLIGSATASPSATGDTTGH